MAVIWLLFGKGLHSIATIIPFIFAGWVIAAGVIRAIGSFTLKSAGAKNWGWLLVLGIQNAVMGVILMYSPWLSVLLVSNLISICLYFPWCQQYHGLFLHKVVKMRIKIN